ncbi:hypothetical protein COT20_02530 [bacterium (Candidatus Gribaldobacteria) CG08_land_8_20_14_0_20_39_15]|uniref:DUF5678 domain-containing protein n=1 Tax=bacterium (Candidatus Gribaldobacteria) CG08_land_8_20_14_0_20_39_15 TaxID=2014273 RepID=A0A2M6XU85_9BACT|nr:MAG: hypothetical protein COT20_02530 [bacterium (Candidatus Gribaldobacteria) CG08_land_8_20_14_0_20_39_15]
MRKDILKINFTKFKGKEIAIVQGKIVASGNSSKAVFAMAKKQFPQLETKDITLLSVPREKVAIYILIK